MRTTRILMMVGLAVVLFACPAFADIIDFQGVSGGTMSYAGGGSDFIGTGIQINLVLGEGTALHAGSHAVTAGVLTFSTGGLVSFANNVYTFGAGAPNSFVITGGVADAGIPGGTTLLSGQILTATLDVSTGTVHLFTVNGTDTKNPTLLSFFGESATAWNFGPGTIHGTPTTGCGAGVVGGPTICDSAFSIDIPNSAVPEPGTLALLGSGLLGIGAMLRRRLGSLWS